MKHVLCTMLCLALVVPQAYGVSTSAQSAILIDAHSGRVLYESNVDERALIASTTKIMTGYLAIMIADPTDKVTIKREHTLVEGTRVYFKEGDVLTVQELLIGVLLQSGNDAALALADHCGGDKGIEGFVEQMNQMAVTLGMTNSRFANPHGLNDDNHYSTARDMATLAAAAMSEPDFAAVSSQKTGQVGSIVVKNHNKMLWNYEGANGIKTGYTKLAGRCLVSSAQRNGQLLIVVTLDDPSDWQDHANLLDYGFSSYPERRLCTEDTFVYELPVVSGVQDRVDVRARDTVNYPLTDGEVALVRAQVELPHFVWAPVEAGQTLGMVRFWKGDQCIGESVLYAAETVSEPAPKNKSMWQRIFSIMSVMNDAGIPMDEYFS